MAGYFSKTDFTPSTSNTYTVSFWVKINNFAPTSSNVPYLWSISSSSTSGLFFQADTTPYNISFFRSQGGVRYVPNNYMRDPNSWYHVHLKVSSGTGTLYYNGESVKTSIAVDAQNYNGGGSAHYVHTYGSGTSTYDNLECIMSHFHFIDGTAYDPTEFGSTDSTTGEWSINPAPNVTYGTNGYFILKDGNSGTDHSGNGNNFTLTGTCTNTEDCPSNIFNTFNPLIKTPSGLSYSHGNTTLTTSNTQWEGSMTTIPLFGGKWYYECKYNTGGNIKLSVVGEQSDYSNFDNSNSSYGEYHGNGYGYQFNNSGADYLGNNNTSPNWSGGLSSNSGDKIFMVALDLDNGYIWYGADGTWFNDSSGYTGNPSTGAYPHQTITAQHLSEKPHIVTGSVEGSGMTGNWNFGNGYFGTTAISSEGTNASGIGKFEYDVPTGFTAISTKGLNE